MKRYIALITLAATLLTLLGGCKGSKKNDDFNLDYYKDMAGLDPSQIELPDGEEVADREFGEGEFNVIGPETNVPDTNEQPSDNKNNDSANKTEIR